MHDWKHTCVHMKRGPRNELYWVSHDETVKSLMKSLVEEMGLYGTHSGGKDFMTITVHGAFEYGRHYESWGFGYTISTGDVEVENECLICGLLTLQEVIRNKIDVDRRNGWFGMPRR